MTEMAIGLSPEGTFKRKLTDKVHNGLRCYEIVDGEVTGMSIVSNPANGVKARVLSEKDQTFSAVILIPDQMIFRINPITGEEFYIYFTKEVITLLQAKYRLKNWTDEERQVLVDLYSEGKTTREIANALERTEDNVKDRIRQEGEFFRNMAIVLMSKKKRTLEEMSIILGISEEELFSIINTLGGKIVKR